MLAVDGCTVAVLAGGIDIPYPAGHSALLHRIGGTGALVTEYPPGIRPARHRFLIRNRLVAALSGATVVVEAGLRSGAASTAAWARAMDRVVCAVPGPVTSAASAGCHQLLRQGAELVTRAEEVIEIVGRCGELADEPEHPVSQLDGLSTDERLVYEALPGAGCGRSSRSLWVPVCPVSACWDRWLCWRSPGWWRSGMGGGASCVPDSGGDSARSGWALWAIAKAAVVLADNAKAAVVLCLCGRHRRRW